MLYQFFIISEGNVLVEWNREGFPGEVNLAESEIVNGERMKKIYAALTAKERGAFNSITLGRLAVSILLRRDVAYAVVCDEDDPLKARKNVLRDLAKEIAPNLKKLQEGKTLGNLEEVMLSKVKGHTRAMAGVRSRSSTAFILALIGGFIFLLALSWAGELFAPSGMEDFFFVKLLKKTSIVEVIQELSGNSLPKGWISLVLFYFLLAILTGLIVGWISGRSVGGFVASFITFMGTFSIPSLFEVVTVPESLLTISETLQEYLFEYYLILSYVRRLSYLNVLLLGGGFGFLSALIAAAIGYVFNSRSLLSAQIAFKPKKKPRKPKKKAKEREPEEVEELEEVEIEEDELEELEELFGE